ncbi:MAG: hypothetical protein AB1938_14555 [Myxococcota bacterium]
MPVERTTDEQGRVRLRLRHKQSLALRFFASVGVFVVLFLFGPGLLSLGSMRAEVRCERTGGVVRCDVREGVLFGLLHLERRAEDVREVALIARNAGSDSTRVALVTQGGAEVPVLSLSSDRNRKEKDALVSELRRFLADANTPRLELTRSFTNAFTWVGAPCSLIWLLVVLSMLTLPRYALRPQVLIIDPAARKLTLRERPGSAKVVSAALEDVESVSVSVNEGGWVGRLTEATNTDEAGRPKAADGASAPPLHLALALKSGTRLVVMNTARLSDEEMRAFADEVAKLLGARRA